MSTATSSFIFGQDSDLINHSIPELASMLRLEFRQSTEYDKVEKALLAREDNLKKDMQILKEKNLVLERLRVEEVANSGKGVLDEYSMVIFNLRGKLSRSEAERLKLESEIEPLQSRIVLLENQVMELLNRSSDGDANVRHKNLQELAGNGNLQLSEDKEADIVRQRVDYLALADMNKKLIEEKVLVENELKDCKGEIDMLKRERDITNARYDACRCVIEDMIEQRIAANVRVKKLLEENRKKMENVSVSNGGFGSQSVKGSRNGLDTTGTSKCSSANIIHFSKHSSDDDNAPGEDTEQNTITMTEMKHRGNQNSPSSLNQMISGQSEEKLSEAVTSVLAKESDESDGSSGFHSSSSDSEDILISHLFKKPKLLESS